MDRLSSALKAAKQIESTRRAVGLVYYFGDGNGKVKIGWSTNPHERLDAAKCFIPEIVLLAMEPGERHLESDRHKQFRGQHIKREWFWLSGFLEKHVNHLQAIMQIGGA